MNHEAQSTDSTFILYNAESMLYSALMARYRKLIEALSKQVSKDSKDVLVLNTEREQLRDAYLRFQELNEIARPTEERLEVTAAMLLNMPQREHVRGNATFGENDFEMSDDAMPIPVTMDRLKLSDYPLWKVIREIVRHMPGIQVVKLENALKDFGIRTRRQSIESALAVHKKDFKITRRGRETFVSLK